MMKCGWCKKIDDSLCCDMLLISLKAFEKFCHLCVMLLSWRSNAFGVEFVNKLHLNFALEEAFDTQRRRLLVK